MKRITAQDFVDDWLTENWPPSPWSALKQMVEDAMSYSRTEALKEAMRIVQTVSSHDVINQLRKLAERKDGK